MQQSLRSTRNANNRLRSFALKCDKRRVGIRVFAVKAVGVMMVVLGVMNAGNQFAHSYVKCLSFDDGKCNDKCDEQQSSL